jgi:hypothetical protein
VLTHHERAQSIPFWTFATIGMLAILMFVLNYAASVTWSVRAQSAADSAAAAGLSVQANVENETTTILYATAIDEYRLRALNAAILNTINHNGGCDPAPGGSCEQDYNVLTYAFNQVQASYLKDVQLLGQADQFTQGGQLQSEVKAATAGYSAIDPTFAYTSTATQSKGKNHFSGDPIVEVMACRNVPYVGFGLLGPAAATFRAVAHGSAAIAPASVETFLPSATNPATGTPYQPTETQWYGQALPTGSTLPAYAVTYGTPGSSNIAVQLTWYSAIPVHATTAFGAGSYACN